MLILRGRRHCIVTRQSALGRKLKNAFKCKGPETALKLLRVDAWYYNSVNDTDQD